MSVELLDYQQEVIDNIYGNDELGIEGLYNSGKRSATVVMPTGGGKSFVSMRVIEEMLERFKVEPSGKYPDAISEFEILYLAPNTGILYQFGMHISKYMSFPHYLEKYKENYQLKESNIKETAKYILDSILPDNLKRIDYELDYDMILKENDYTVENNLEDIIKEIVGENLKNYSEKDFKDIISKSYPNFSLECYQNLHNIDFKKINPKVVICDEAHRGAANKWLKYLTKAVRTLKDSFFLMTTATPDRNNDDRSLLESVAKLTGYTPEEIQEEKYYAKEYYLIEAIRDGRVVNPKIVGFPCTLDESQEYQKVSKKLKELKEKKPKGGSSLDKQMRTVELIKNMMDEIIGKRVNGKTLSEEDWQKKKKLLIDEILNKRGDDLSALNSNGKYIAFIPSSNNTEFEEEDYGKIKDGTKEELAKIRSKRNVKNYIKKLKQLFGEKISTHVYHSVNNEEDNNKSLQMFQKFKSYVDGLKFIVTNKKLCEGVHIEDCDGIIMLEQIMPNAKGGLAIKFLQQFGRIIRAIKPNENPNKIKVPVVYDYANNFMRNYENLKLDGEILLDYDQSETGVSDFFDLYRIFDNSPKFYGTREEDGERIYEFEFSRSKPIMKYPNFDTRRKVFKRTTKQRFDILIKTLEILEKCQVEPKIDLNRLPKDIVINNDFFDRYNIPKDEASRIRGLLLDAGTLTRSFKEYNLGEELNHLKRVFYGVSTDKKMKNILIESDISPEILANLGILYLSSEERLMPEFSQVVDMNGFIKPNRKMLNCENSSDISFLEKFVGLNIYTGTRYYLGKDEFGCYKPGTKDEYGNDLSGYDIYGYDKYGFNKDGIHRITGQKYNENYFTRMVDEEGKISFVNAITGKTTDVFGYNIDGINPETGFDNGIGKEQNNSYYTKHYWHKFNADTGKFSRIYADLNLDREPPVDEYGASSANKRTDIIRPPFCKDRKSVNGGGYYDKYTGLNIDEFDIEGFREVTIEVDGIEVTKHFYRENGSEYNYSGIDYNGNLEPNLRKGMEILGIIFNSGDRIKNPRFREKLMSRLKMKYESRGESLDDILDKGLTMYRMSPLLTENDDYSNSVRFIEKSFENNEEACEFIREISPKFHNQIVLSTEFAREMRSVFLSKMQKLYAEIQLKYGNEIPVNVMAKIIELNKKYEGLKKNNFLRIDDTKDSAYREF